MARYRKKPVVIEAFQMTEAMFAADGHPEWPEWAQQAVEAPAGTGIEMHGPDGIACYIATMEGRMACNFDDWIIRGTKGEIYPCKPDIFADIYEVVA